MPKKNRKVKSKKQTTKRNGFVTLLLVGLVVGLGLLMAGSFIPEEKFSKDGDPAGEVVPQPPQSSKNNLELKPLAFTSPKVCDFDSIKGDGCSCPTTQKYGPASDGKFYYTTQPEQECRFVAPDKVNDECTLLKMCEQNVGACSWNAPGAGPGSDCKVPVSMSGEYVDGILPPADSRNLSVSCAGWKTRMLAQGPNETWCVGKPVIYLYPEKPTLVDVELFIPGEIYISIPKYPQGGWKNVFAQPNGDLVYEGEKHTELYYETKVEIKKIPQNGIIIPTSDLKNRLWEITGKLGLKPSEQEDFLEYWMPLLTDLKKPFIIFSLIEHEEKERIDGVAFNPQPDVFINFIAYFKGIDYPVALSEFKFAPVPARRGFTAVEWGGTIDSQ